MPSTCSHCGAEVSWDGAWLALATDQPRTCPKRPLSGHRADVRPAYKLWQYSGTGERLSLEFISEAQLVATLRAAEELNAVLGYRSWTVEPLPGAPTTTRTRSI